MADRLPVVLTEIRSLLRVPSQDDLPPRSSLEHTLTDGYAYALGLERERLRIERRLRAVLSAEDSASGDASELAGQLAAAERELADLRALLSEFREHTFS